MRKKSHIAVAAFLSRELQLEELTKYRKSFYLGSILPDLTPSIVTEPHQFGITFENLKTKMQEISQISDAEEQQRSLWRSIGVILHYLADYFTFPHNDSYTGNLKDHCVYEGDLKHQMRAYVASRDARVIFEKQCRIMTESVSLADLFENIEKAHREYMNQGSVHTPKDDCRWILTVCSGVLLYFVSRIKNGINLAAFGIEQAA